MGNRPSNFAAAGARIATITPCFASQHSRIDLGQASPSVAVGKAIAIAKA